MLGRWIVLAAVGVSLVGAATPRAQVEPPPRKQVEPAVAIDAAKTGEHATVREIYFAGLRRTSPEALRNDIASRPGDALDAAKIERDVRALARTGWFETVRAEVEPATNPGANSPEMGSFVRLTFFVPELPFLTGLEYRGSRLLSRAQVEKLLAEKKLTPKLGQPVNPLTLHRVGRLIESTLAELGHPRAHVEIAMEESGQATVLARFQINDGAHLPVERVVFEGNPALPQKMLSRQMRLSPGSLFAGLRGKNAYTPAEFTEDRERLLAYYQDNGYPEARVGAAKIYDYESCSRRWFPWPQKTERTNLGVTIPVEAGGFYRIESVTTSEALARAAGVGPLGGAWRDRAAPTQAYSAQNVESLRRAWESRVRARGKKVNVAAQLGGVEANRTLDARTHSVRIKMDLSSAPLYIVRRLEFRGNRYFPDRYFRKRIGVQEGEALNDRTLEAGLQRLARTGYFKPIKKPDIQVLPNDVTHTLDVVIHIEELGKQRVSLVGGRGQFGSTLGMAYSLFNILDREELLTSKIEGGPETLELALSFAKEGFLGSRGSLALSVFNTFLRPRLAGGVQGPFYKQRTEGVTADSSYSLSSADALSVNYSLSHSLTTYPPALPTVLTGLPTNSASAETSSHAVGAGWTHDSGNEQIVLANSVSGGWLGGTENVVRSKLEYSRIARDPFFSTSNSWAFRTTFHGAGSYSGDMPFTARLFAGDGYVRGLREGELGPLAVVSSSSSSGRTFHSASPAGANLIEAGNAEYRVRLNRSMEAAGFFDLGSGSLLPNWLGNSRPSLIDSTNGILHGSTGVELRWTLPAIGIPVRAYYALNVLRLNRSALLPDQSILRVRNRFAAFGWELGSLF
jgi:outer membrane protein assembly complex protein YaeT